MTKNDNRNISLKYYIYNQFLEDNYEVWNMCGYIYIYIYTHTQCESASEFGILDFILITLLYMCFKLHGHSLGG